MKLDWRIEWLQWAIIAAMFAAAAALWSSSPAQFPVHWNAYGAVDRYGGRFESLLMLPLIAFSVYLLLVLIPIIDPGRANYDQFAHAYAALRLALVLFLGVTWAAIQAVARGYQIGMAELPNLAVGAILIVTGNLLAKVRPNWFIGIRTPWTLSSKTAWDRTHRFGAWLFAIAGILVLADVFVPPPYRTIPLVVLPAGAALAATVYSYIVWRTAPDKIPPAGTMPT
jgi:uncharacterized membrane protein